MGKEVVKHVNGKEERQNQIITQYGKNDLLNNTLSCT